MTDTRATQPAASPEAPAGGFDFNARDTLELPGGASAPGGDTRDLEERVLDAMRTVYDPEIPVNIVELGLIYDLQIDAEGRVKIDMTVTAPNCPVADSLPGQVADVVRLVDGVTEAQVNLVWTPPWTQDRMSEEAKLQLNLW